MIISDGRKIKVYNYSTDTLYSGKIVLVKGKNASLANPGSSSDNIQYLLGMCVDTIYPATYGEVLLEGTVSKVNTSSYANTTVLYLDTEGRFTDVVPTVFSETVVIGHVLVSDVEGQIYFKAVPSVQSPTTWGTITGDIGFQDDLIDLVDAKFDKPTGTTSQYIRGDGTLATLPTGGGGGISHTTASGTDTYTATVSGVASYVDGDAYLVRFTNGNTTTATLNINGIGAVNLYRNNDGPLVPGDILDGAEMLCVYNSTTPSFQCIGTSPNTLLSYVTNDDIVTITKGQPVYASGGVGDRLKVKLAYNTSDATSAQTIGLVFSTSIAAGQKGIIIMQGLLTGLNTLDTSTWADSDPVYLGATAGTITKTKPYGSNHLVYLGFVTTASNGSAGRMYVRVQNGYEIDELHNVSAKTPNGGDTLVYNKDTNLWEAKTAVVPAGMTWMGAFPG